MNANIVKTTLHRPASTLDDLRGEIATSKQSAIGAPIRVHSRPFAVLPNQSTKTGR